MAFYESAKTFNIEGLYILLSNFSGILSDELTVASVGVTEIKEALNGYDAIVS